MLDPGVELFAGDANGEGIGDAVMKLRVSTSRA